VSTSEVVRAQLSDGPWGPLLGALAARGFTGEVTIESDGKRYAIELRRGSVVGASSPLVADAIIRVALTAHLITPVNIATIARALGASGKRDEVDVVAETVRLTTVQAETLRARAVAQRAARTFSLEAGDVAITPSPAGPPRAGGAEIEIGAVIFAGARLHMTDVRLASELRRLGSRFALTERADALLPKFGFGAEGVAIASSIRGGGASLAELEATHREIDPRAAAAAIYALVSCGAAAATAPSTSASASAAPAAVHADAHTAPTERVPIAVARTASEMFEAVPTRPVAPLAPRTLTPSVPSLAGRGAATPTSRPPIASQLRAITATAPASATAKTTVQPVVHARAITAQPPAVSRAITAQPAAASPPAVSRAGTAQPAAASAPAAPRTVTAQPRATTAPLPRTRSDVIVPRTVTPSVAPATSRTRTDALTARGVPTVSRQPTDLAVPVADLAVPRADSVTRPAVSRTMTPRWTAESLAELEKVVASRLVMIDQGADYFSVLGLAFDAPVEAVRAAHRQLSRALAPESLAQHATPALAESGARLLSHVAAALAVLGDPARRAAYVATLRRTSDPHMGVPRTRTTEGERSPAEEAIHRGLLAMRADQPERAAVELARACELEPNNIDHTVLLAWARFCAATDKGTAAPAARKMLQAASRQSDRPQLALFYLGRVERMLGRDREALERFHEALERDPANLEAAAEIRVLESRRANTRR
jgi:hypothetical protein